MNNINNKLKDIREKIEQIYKLEVENPKYITISNGDKYSEDQKNHNRKVTEEYFILFEISQ